MSEKEGRVQDSERNSPGSKRKRYGDRPTADESGGSIVIWTLVVGLLVGALAGLIVTVLKGWEKGLIMGGIGFGLGMIAGAIAGSIGYLPRNPYNFRDREAEWQSLSKVAPTIEIAGNDEYLSTTIRRTE